MTEPQPPTDDRWQQLFRAFDPERNVRAIAELMQQAAAGSEQALESVTQGGDGSNDDGSVPLRDLITQFEQSWSRLYEAGRQFVVERPLGNQAGGAVPGGARAEIAVLDGVGTTVVQIPGAEGAPHCGDLRRDSYVAIPAEAVTIIRSQSFDGDSPTFVIRVDVPPSTEPGVYHCQVLVEGLPEYALPLVVTVVEPDE